MSAPTAHAWRRRVSDYHSGVSADERAAVEAHLAECAECRLALAAYRRLYTLARSPLRLGDSGAGALAEYRPMLLEETMLTTDPDTRSAPPWRRPPTRLTALGAIAAVLVLAILAAALFTHFRGPAPVTPRPTPTATVPPLTWRQATLPSGYALPGLNAPDNGFAVSPADGQRAWACAPIANQPGAFTLWATRDGATTWQQVSTLTAQAPETPQRCILTTDQYDSHTLVAELSWGSFQIAPRWVSLLSTDDGATWQALPGQLGVDALATNNGTRYAVVHDSTNDSDHGRLVTITSAGGALSLHPTGLPALAANTYIFHLWMRPPDPVMFVADSPTGFWRSDDAGAHWTALTTTPSGAILFGRWIAARHSWLFCTPSTDAMQCSDDGGQSWPLRLAQGIARGCIVGDITADGALLAACADNPNAEQFGSFTLTRVVPGTLASRQIGTVASPAFLLTATGQIWGFDPSRATVYVATLAG
jgi:hypothetical protein